MDAYDRQAQLAARQLTQAYSTSFSLAARLFGRAIRQDVYNIYGLVRLADEIVDTYRGDDAADVLDGLEAETYRALDGGYSPNLLVHAFCLTARRCDIDSDLVRPFFASMRLDLAPQRYTQALYERYIYGSAEVVGLMCLRVFCGGQTAEYDQLAPGAQALGSALQKVNFLRDLAHDREVLGRNYFPDLQSKPLDESAKQRIVDDIEQDFASAAGYIKRLPPAARLATAVSYRQYHELLAVLRRTPAADLSQRRVRLSNGRKLWLLAVTAVRQRFGSM